MSRQSRSGQRTVIPSSAASICVVESLELRVLLAAPVFGANSADFSNVPYIHTRDGVVRHYEGLGGLAGQSYTESYHRDVMLGVSTLRFDTSAFDGDPGESIWAAMDTQGRPYVFKVVSGGQTEFQATSLSGLFSASDAPDIMFRLATGVTPTVGYSITEDGETQTITSTTATLPQFPGQQFVKVRWQDGDAYDDYSYYHPSVGVVLETWGGNNPTTSNGFKISGWPIASLSNGQLTVNGSNFADTISVVGNGTSWTVTMNGDRQSFSAGSVNAIRVLANGGRDSVSLTSPLLGISVAGGGGADTIYGSVGNDSLNGNGGTDLLVGGAGADALQGAAGNDTLQGGGGADSLSGAAGDDQLKGGGGADTLTGGLGRDLIAGAGGNDYIYARDGAADTITAGLGTDRGQYDSGTDQLRDLIELGL